MSVTTQEIVSVVNVPLRTSLFTGVTAEQSINIVESCFRGALFISRMCDQFLVF